MKKGLAILMVLLSSLVIVACNQTQTEDTSRIIQIEATVNKAEYQIGESFSANDIKVVAKKLDGTKVDLNQTQQDASIENLTYMVTGFDSSTAGTKVLQIISGDFQTLTQYKVKESVPAAIKHKARFVNYDGKVVSESRDLNDGAQLIKPDKNPTRPGYTFTGWFLSGTDHMWDFLNDRVNEDTTLEARYLLLNENNLLVDAYATPSTYVFNTLQELEESNLMKNGVKVFFAPGVYWTNDYKDTTQATVNTGITFNFSDMIFQGITSDASDVIISANRCYEDGSSTGNYNVIAVGRNFTALNISIANYAAFDLVYPRDPSQNVAARIPAVNGNPNFNTHGQTIAGGGGNVYMENVRIVAYLNLMAGFSADNGYFKDCYFQLADDAVFGGARNIYENCVFDLYGQRPSAGGSSDLTIFYNCTFNGLNNPNEPQRFAKTTGQNTQFVVIDSIFTGAIKSVVWENTLRVNKVHYTYNNKFADGTPVPFTPNDPWATEELVEGSSLDVYKNGNGYEKAAFLGFTPSLSNPTPKVQQVYRLNLTPGSTTLFSDDPDNEIIITPSLFPTGIYTYDQITWVYDKDLFELNDEVADEKLHLSAKLNSTGNIIKTEVIGITPNGIKGRVVVYINPEKVAAPVLTDKNIKIVDGIAKLTYKLDNEKFEDHSDIKWYTGDTKGAKTTLVGVSSLNEPFKEFKLGLSHVNKFLTVEITPKYRFSDAAKDVISIEMDEVITLEQIKDKDEVHTNFANLPWNSDVINVITDKDVFYADVIKPSDYTGNITLTEGSIPFRYELGAQGGFSGLSGLRMVSQGARLIYTPSFKVADMSMSLDYSTVKTEGQAFGGTPQSMEVFFKFDFATYTGYSIRITRTSLASNATKWELFEYNQGEVKPLIGNYKIPTTQEPGDDISLYYSCALPLSNIKISVVGNKITVKGTTQTEQTPTQKASYLHEVNYEYTVNSMNDLGGFGMQLTTTAGNPMMYHGVDVVYTRTE